MLVFAIVLFLIAVPFGVVLLKAVLTHKRRPRVVMLMHGSFAFFGLLITATYLTLTDRLSPLLITGFVLLFVAALGGFTLLTIDLSKKPIPRAMALMHPLLALAGVIVLIIYALL
jgi:hypothetical protein